MYFVLALILLDFFVRIAMDNVILSVVDVVYWY